MGIRHFCTMIVPLLCFFVACGQDEAQIQFERDAYSQPSGYTHTSGTGAVDEDNIDSDDWRISPFFSGLVYSIDPVYPNPVQSNDRLTLQINLAGMNDVQRIHVYSIDKQMLPLKYVDSYPGPIPSVIILTINARQIPVNPQNPKGLHRLLVTDERENVITYGDVQIE